MSKKLNFSFEFFERNTVFPFYQGVYNKTNGTTLINSNLDSRGEYLNKICIVQYIPPYFELKMDKENSPFDLYKITAIPGFRADLEGFNNVEEYMKVQLSKGVMKTIKSRLRRLEKCFDITYEMYYGAITKEKYSFLFDQLEIMINKRFAQRNEGHSGLKKWALYKENAYQLILDKKATFFLISDGEKPIVIGLNFLYQNIFDSAITSYDIDYAKFGLGNIAVLRKMEWCFNNGFSRFDMRWGDLAYKRLWCNAIEQYECHILYNKKNIGYRISAYMVILIMKFKIYLREKNILPIKPKIRSIYKRIAKRSASKETKVTNVELVDLSGNECYSEHHKVDTSTDEYSFLRKIRYDFQYINSEHSNSINIYKMFDRDNSYIIAGKNKTQQIIFKN
ncbi:Acetyltransferase (GNAT) domain-containing protein [Arenibacter palladensis]|uniref:Acetyltransferase (GNAT) domain-containing protein n=1 Tax=Arenibacter palladensis TaxID=237373 RepID=A0A1M5EJC3_9FLAO|nr:GNAT family N-acetyltransferase [Arenibacter palladensis]SHF79335.1 Acetyltransferase (GNAT) domain-containing protein [Arenibacter palladensis]